MYNTGTHQVEHIVKKNNKYPLKGKSDLVFQNEGENDVVIGIRVVKPNASYRMCSCTTVLDNNPIRIAFKGTGVNNLWVHFIEPKKDNCSI